LLTKENKLQDLIAEQFPVLIVLALLVLAHLLSGIIVIIAFIAAIILFVYKKYDGRIPVALAIALLVIAAMTLSLQSEATANQFATESYYFFVIGVLILFINYLREGPSEDE